MDNVIQNIKIEDIVPRSRQNQDDIRTLEELVISIKNNGIKEPLILKRKNDRYEIISGTRRYKAAIIAGLSTVPAIIKDYDDKNLIKKNNYISLNSINNNFDIVNLSELNKEYERDDFNMNNELMNNNNMGQPASNPGTAPAFGGRFFPSLEDEPTNMSFNQNIEPTPSPQGQPMPTNNFIDLTDTNNDFQNNNVQHQSIENQISVAPSTQLENNINNNLTPQGNGNIINLENLTQNNDMVQPIPSPIQNANIDNNFQEIINDFQPNPSQTIVPTLNQVAEPSMSVESVSPNLSIGPTPNIESTMNNTINLPGDIAPNTIEQSQIIPTPEVANIPTSDISMQSTNIVPNIEPQPVQLEVIESNQPETAVQPTQQKNVLPVINTLKSVGVNLESFGYTIRITDEDLPTSYKITIEVEK